MVSDAPKHYPVLLNEIISIITPQHGGTFIDCTFGQGGYSKKILEFSNTKVIALDRDLDSKKIAENLIQKHSDRILFKNLKFSQLKNLKLKDENIKGIVFDLGYSFSQMKDYKKGLSFNSTGELNMKLGMNDFSAKEVINQLNSEDLETILKNFGEEKEAKRIVNNILKIRKDKEIDTKLLVKIIETTKRKKSYKTHSATKTFQALRIFVNKEISELINGLIQASKVLKKDGILAVVTFHSLEDKIVKYFFKSLSEKKTFSRYEPKVDQPETLFFMKQKKPIIPTKKELSENISSRSAKLRFVIKKKDSFEFQTDILEKFKFLIDIENLGNKI